MLVCDVTVIYSSLLLTLPSNLLSQAGSDRLTSLFINFVRYWNFMMGYYKEKSKSGDIYSSPVA